MSHEQYPSSIVEKYITDLTSVYEKSTDQKFQKTDKDQKHYFTRKDLGLQAWARGYRFKPTTPI